MGVLKWLNEHFEESILLILLIVMTCVMGVQVTMRYLLNASLSWSEELTRYMFVWSAFISVSYCIKKGISIRIDQFTNMMPQSAQKVLGIITRIVMLIFFAYVFRYALIVVGTTYVNGQTSPALGLPIYLVQVSSVIGFGLAVVRILQSFWGDLKSVKTAR
ncbi:TRAP-type C4-dicarboxylate transport system permease small subunit [Anaerosolibacter carboniphilus]|uniref:TRAP-type C4-dicarboxylate transport system permease small subunit n=1 Tax=Anaerosolibacter carboniphilus TaxID=1417629 RepID=A0A841KTB3_9FIRM|nr:TRAP transporter small permease [Anaerosolibacter carboniphilus]MBB6215270.1 TRAP-type C4-dicarboxylate transport system permease small subunit [Anaerosolibacter carboniphilus]